MMTNRMDGWNDGTRRSPRTHSTVTEDSVSLGMTYGVTVTLLQSYIDSTPSSYSDLTGLCSYAI